MAQLPQNTFKAALKAGILQRGLWSTINDTLVAELSAAQGFDWMLFDTEHSALDPITVLPLLQAVAPYPVTPIVRPGSLNAAEIKKLLDLGAQTILVPMVNNAKEAADAVRAVTYPPAGIRGVSGLTRATNFAAIPGYHKIAREEICLLIQVETLEAIDNIEAMAAVEGIDGIFVGPADLAAAMGHAGEPNNPEVKEACRNAIKRIVASGQPAGILTLDEEFAEEAIQLGATFVSNDVDMAALKRGLLARK